MRRIAIIVAVTGALLSACGMHDMSNMSGPSQSADNNQQDVTFAKGMIPHHAQAVAMAKLVPSRSTNPELLDLASKVEGAQDPEITTMRGWLSSWGEQMPTDAGQAGHDMSTMGKVEGMMSADDMAKLTAASGAEFDKMWMDMMIRHHEGAVTMARSELDKGKNADAKALAQRIVDAQRGEITKMQGMLAK